MSSTCGTRVNLFLSFSIIQLSTRVFLDKIFINFFKLINIQCIFIISTSTPTPPRSTPPSRTSQLHNVSSHLPSSICTAYLLFGGEAIPEV